MFLLLPGGETGHDLGIASALTTLLLTSLSRDYYAVAHGTESPPLVRSGDGDGDGLPRRPDL